MRPECLYCSDILSAAWLLQADPPPPTAAKEAVLSEARFRQLDQLLNRTGMYTQFLTEQLAAISKKPAAGSSCEQSVEADEQEEDADGAKGKGKRKGGKAAARTNKRQKEEAPEDQPSTSSGLTPTQVCAWHA